MPYHYIARFRTWIQGSLNVDRTWILNLDNPGSDPGSHPDSNLENPIHEYSRNKTQRFHSGTPVDLPSSLECSKSATCRIRRYCSCGEPPHRLQSNAFETRQAVVKLRINLLQCGLPSLDVVTSQNFSTAVLVFCSGCRKKPKFWRVFSGP